MNISQKHIQSRRTIGKLKGKPVHEVVTTGGLHLIVVQKDGAGLHTLGTGPHRAVARHIALRNAPELEITELSKGDDLDQSALEAALPAFSELTNRLRSLE